MRYFLRISYDGSNFAGWQRQNNAISVQEVLENSLSTKLRNKISVVGCGRTDAGVHASDYVLHFDHVSPLPSDFLYAINRMLPTGVAVHEAQSIHSDFHARFDAIQRSYTYKIHTEKDPFRTLYSYYFPPILKADFEKMDEVASMLLKYSEFKPFCKAHSDVKTMKCQLSVASWKMDHSHGEFTFHISADRFLRGMVRLIVGSCIQCAMGKVKLEEIEKALQEQSILPGPLSVPAKGLFLSKIEYPDFGSESIDHWSG